MRVYSLMLTVFQFKYVHIHTVMVLSLLLRVHWRRRRSLHFRCAVAKASLSRGIQAQAGRPILSDQVCATEQQKPAATCTGAPQLYAEVPWQSW